MNPTIDLRADLHDEDDDGRNWSLLRDAADPALVVPGAVLMAGDVGLWAPVRVHAVDPDGQVHFEQLADDDPSSIAVRRRAFGG